MNWSYLHQYHPTPYTSPSCFWWCYWYHRLSNWNMKDFSLILVHNISKRNQVIIWLAASTFFFRINFWGMLKMHQLVFKLFFLRYCSTGFERIEHKWKEELRQVGLQFSPAMCLWQQVLILKWIPSSSDLAILLNSNPFWDKLKSS